MVAGFGMAEESPRTRLVLPTCGDCSAEEQAVTDAEDALDAAYTDYIDCLESNDPCGE